MPLNAKARVFVVTGANSGIGKAPALGLARPGGTVVMACRNADRSEAARQDIVRQSGNAHVAVMIVDLASEASTRAFAEEFQRRYPRLDAPVNNAGGYMSRREGTADGPRPTFGGDYPPRFLLAQVLLPPLKKTPPL